MPIIYPEEQTSAFLLCASETLWFNPSWWNVINEGLPQSGCVSFQEKAGSIQEDS